MRQLKTGLAGSGRSRSQAGTQGWRGLTARLAAAAAVCGWASGALGQWSANYAIQRVGLLGPSYTNSFGNQTSFTAIGAGRYVAGLSFRYDATGAGAGRDGWLWTGTATRPIGLTGGVNTSPGGQREAEIRLINEAGFVAGLSSRYPSGEFANGRSAWVWDGSDTRVLGFGGAGYTNQNGYQYSEPRLMNLAGQVVGYSFRYNQSQDNLGTDTWVFDGSGSGLSRLVGLTTPAHTGTGGFRSSNPRLQNEAGLVVGTSQRVINEFLYNGQDVWGFSGTAAAGSTQTLGLSSAAHVGSNGYRESEPRGLNATGQVVGTSARVLDVNTPNGRDAWLWRDGTTRAIGLVGGIYTGTGGFQSSITVEQNDAGRVIGTSNRVTGIDTFNGFDAWLWDGTATRLIGLTGTDYLGSGGYRQGQPRFINAAGQVAGYTARVFNATDSLGQDAWVSSGVTTRLIGLTGAGYTYNREGRPVRDVGPRFQSDSGVIVGDSTRFDVNTGSGRGSDAWAWDPAANAGAGATLLIGLAAPANTASNGLRINQAYALDAAGRAWGYTDRFSGLNGNGRDAWVWSRPTGGGPGVTRQLGLTGGVHTGATGYQVTEVQFHNPSGVIVGYSNRVAGSFNNIGVDAWYFDPATLTTHTISPSVRTGFDNFASASANLLTEDGFMLGSYYFFEGGNGNGELRGFAFRPDRGFIDLGDLVAGGLAASGWRAIDSPEYSEGVQAIVGSGTITGQNFGNAVFALTIGPPCVPVAVAAAPGVLSLCGVPSATLTVNATGTDPLTYSWRRAGVAINPANNPSAATATLVIPAASAADVGLYDCVVGNSCGSVTTASVRLRVCPIDFNCDGVLNQEDLSGYLTAFLDERVPPGPSGTGTAPCPGAPAPYDVTGYATDFNRDCVFNQEDLSGFITTYFTESEAPSSCLPG